MTGISPVKFWYPTESVEEIFSLNAYSPIIDPPIPVVAISAKEPDGKPILKDAPAMN